MFGKKQRTPAAKNLTGALVRRPTAPRTARESITETGTLPEQPQAQQPQPATAAQAQPSAPSITHTAPNAAAAAQTASTSAAAPTPTQRALKWAPFTWVTYATFTCLLCLQAALWFVGLLKF